MRIHLNEHYFISVIHKLPESQQDKQYPHYSCQVMNLVHGLGMINATIYDNQEDVVGCIVHKGFSQTSKNVYTLQEVFDFHLQCLKELSILTSDADDSDEVALRF